MLISCLMPTANRRHLVPMALNCFLSQEFPEKELIVIDDGADMVGDLFEGIPQVRYFWSGTRRSIGEKLNEACDHAAGSVMVRFDDDDWSASSRLSDQVGRLAGKSVSGYHSLLFWDIAGKSGSKYQGGPNYALGTSLCFTRDYWKSSPFKTCSTGEDSIFIRKAQLDKSIASVDGGQMMVARVHPNSASKRTGPLSWPTVDAKLFPPAFFEALNS
jgi:glycosyltransferase involved in cell wall biosynthesis